MRLLACLLAAGVGLYMLIGLFATETPAQQTLPSGKYLEHPPQYVPPSPSFPLKREAAAQEAQQTVPPPLNMPILDARGGAGAALPPAAPVGPAAPQLPLAQAVLFSSGVGYFQREGVVEGTGRVDLSFPVGDINDLLKSMVVRDLDGGHVGAVSYDSNAPVEKTLGSFALNLNGNPSFAQVLVQARGEKVEVQIQGSACSGTLMGVEKQHVPAGKDSVEVDVITLSCADGMRTFKLTDVVRVRFLNPVMESELKKALETLAQSHDTQKKAVSINFVGEGKRNVRVGYVVENPVWKTSYRLVLGKDTKPYLQGWAVVENVSDEDWKDVRVALISGRPVSFQMDLYQPLFVPRPTVTPETYASVRPPVYNGAMAQAGQQPFNFYLGYSGGSGTSSSGAPAACAAPPSAIPPPPPGAPAAPQPGSRLTMGRRMPPVSNTNQQALQFGFEQPMLQGFGDEIGQLRGLQSTVNAAAQATKLGDYFEYVIQHPVTLPRQKSALLPIVGKNVEATQVSIFSAMDAATPTASACMKRPVTSYYRNAGNAEPTPAQHPMLGVKLKNTTGLHLMQGPITVFENGVYAGDARILDLQPKEERLIAYAVDLGTEVEVVPQKDAGRVTMLKVQKGILTTTIKARSGRTYRVKNRTEQEKVVMIEHPYHPELTLVSKEKPSERTRDAYRFEMKVPAGKSATLDVAEECDISTTAQISNADDQVIRLLVSSKASSAALKDAMKKAQEMHLALAATQQLGRDVTAQLSVITDDQARLRENLKTMPANAAAYKRYLDKFDRQETQIEKLQAERSTHDTKAAQQRHDLEAYVLGLDLESPVDGVVPVEEFEAAPPEPKVQIGLSTTRWRP
jgi:hypothetical protein